MFVVKLQYPMDCQDVGAKAANLARAMELGLSVPKGFVVTRQALSLFLEETGLLSAARRLIDGDRVDDAARRTEYAALTEEMLRAPIPRPIAEGVKPIVQELLNESLQGLAVRSSGVHEDSVKASFAGIYESFLGVGSPAEFWKAMRLCWCSAWSPEATRYACKLGIEPTADQMAVLVQEVIPADTAGVIFTADPATGNPWRFVLDSAFGLARDVVGGHAASDTFVLDWEGEILERRVVEKPTMLEVTPPGVREVDVPEARRNEPSLMDTEVNENVPLDQVRAFLRDRHPDCRFLARYEQVCWEVGLTPPSLRERGEDPGIFNEAQTLFTVRAMLIDSAADVEVTWRKSRRRAEVRADDVRRELSGDAERLARFERLLDWARYWGPALNDRTLCVILFSRMHEAVWRTGQALMEEGIATTVEDVHLLTSADLPKIAMFSDPATGRALIEKRRHEFERNRRLTPPGFLGARPEAPHPTAAPSPPAAKPKGGDGPVLTGQGVTPWSATGMARIVNNLNDPALLASLTPETILVCDGSSISYYADWVSLFLVVAGLVIVGRHRGMHHARQISRECGVAFVHLPETELISLKDGAPIAIDGTAGKVTLLGENG